MQKDVTSGKVIIFSAPSGAGKTTIGKLVLQTMPELEFSISACSREKRPGEVHGKDYYFLSLDEFNQQIKNDAFIEYEQVYPGSFYGTLKEEVERIWQNGHHVLFDVDTLGGLRLKEIFGTQALALFIVPPSIQILEQRLRERGTETEESLAKRMARAQFELDHAHRFDVQIVNNVFEEAVQRTISVIKQFIDA